MILVNKRGPLLETGYIANPKLFFELNSIEKTVISDIGCYNMTSAQVRSNNTKLTRL